MANRMVQLKSADILDLNGIAKDEVYRETTFIGELPPADEAKPYRSIWCRQCAFCLLRFGLLVICLLAFFGMIYVISYHFADHKGGFAESTFLASNESSKISPEMKMDNQTGNNANFTMRPLIKEIRSVGLDWDGNGNLTARDDVVNLDEK